MNKCDIYHLSTSTPHVGACGVLASAVRNGHALTSVLARVTCESCRALVRPEAVGRSWWGDRRMVGEKQTATACETAETSDVVHRRLRVSWR